MNHHTNHITTHHHSHSRPHSRPQSPPHHRSNHLSSHPNRRLNHHPTRHPNRRLNHHPTRHPRGDNSCRLSRSSVRTHNNMPGPDSHKIDRSQVPFLRKGYTSTGCGRSNSVEGAFACLEFALRGAEHRLHFHEER